MRPIEIKPDIFWVGAIDWAVRDFHGYVTPHGTSYNNYLIMDEQPTLIDTVKHDFDQATVESIRAVTDFSKIKNIIINHIEPDHVSSLDTIMELVPKGTPIYISDKGAKGLARYYNTANWDLHIVKTGDTLNIGKRTLLFIETPMLHWPDSMMTYAKEDHVLFSQDAFGQHLASSSRFDDEFVTCASVSELNDAVIDYYANILMPFGAQIRRKIDEVVQLGLEIELIAPDHGVIWRRDVPRILQMYNDMAGGAAELSVNIIYDTMWQSTERMTLPIMQGVQSEGIECKVFKLRSTPSSICIKEFWKSRGTIVGSPTLNNVLFPPVAEFLTHIRGLRPKARLMGAFGSFGWGGGAVREAYAEFAKMGLESVPGGPECQFRPTDEDKDKCFEYGREFAIKTREAHEKIMNELAANKA